MTAGLNGLRRASGLSGAAEAGVAARWSRVDEHRAARGLAGSSPAHRARFSARYPESLGSRAAARSNIKSSAAARNEIGAALIGGNAAARVGVGCRGGAALATDRFRPGVGRRELATSQREKEYRSGKTKRLVGYVSRRSVHLLFLFSKTKEREIAR